MSGKRSNSPVALAHLGPDVGTKTSQSSGDADHSAQNHKSKLSHPQFWSLSSHLKSWALNEDLLKYLWTDLRLRLEEDLSKAICTFALKYVAISRVSGMDFPIPPLFLWSTVTVLTAVGGGQNAVTIMQCSKFH